MDDGRTLLESSSAGPRSPFDKIIFESERKSIKTPYGPSPFATVVESTSAPVAVATSGLLSLGGISQQPGTASNASRLNRNADFFHL